MFAPIEESSSRTVRLPLILFNEFEIHQNEKFAKSLYIKIIKSSTCSTGEDQRK
jgi:hypothetical protein